MSGIAGILHLDGAPVDRSLIAAMADALTFRGPDAQNIWTDGPVGFAHTLLATTFESQGERQPATLDGQVWITADARIDARDDLARELGLPQSALARPDCELILHAYARWGESCVDHLLGDFAFAIWDGRARKLFCARDQFGVKPFFYVHLGQKFIFSNTLDCVRLHPDVSDELNELAIADFLVFDFNQDLSTTTFQDIRRLPPAHVMTVTQSGIAIRRYWSLPEGDRIRYRRTSDYVEHFRTLLESAVSDRLRVPRAAIFMSGGLDSTSVAAFARKVRPETELRAHTWVYDWLIPDDERHFAGLAADALGMEIEYLPYDDAKPFDYTLDAPSPEPVHVAFWGRNVDQHHGIVARTPVVLTGDGSDPLFCLSPLTTWRSLRAIPLGDFSVNMLHYAVDQRAIPKFRLRSTALHFLRRSPQDRPEIPAWLDHGFSQRCNIRDRVDAYVRADSAPAGLRPLARSSLSSVFWPAIFETQDAAWFRAGIEYRNPYFDLRLVRWLMAIPELPYSMDKWLLRMSLREMLPEAVRTRPKTALRRNPTFAAFQRYGIGVPQPLRLHPGMHGYVDSAAVPVLMRDVTPQRFWTDTRLISLENWLTSQEKNTCKKKLASAFAPPTVRLNCESMAT